MEQAIQRRSTMQITQAQELEAKLKLMSEKGSGEDGADAENRQIVSDGRKHVAMQWIAIIANMQRVRKMTWAIESYRIQKHVSESE
jgi:hypothetical protein